MKRECIARERESECFVLWVSLSQAPLIRTAIRRTSGRALPFLPDPMGRQRFLKDLTTGLLYRSLKLIQSYVS
jgi:hypothetical protein